MPSLASLRWLLYTVVAAFEAIRIYLVVLLLGTVLPTPPVNWLVLLIVIACAALAARRWNRLDRSDRRALLVAALLVAALATAFELWSTQTDSRSGASGWTAAYLGFLLFLWAWWRGLGVLDHDHGTLILLVRRSILLVTVGGILLSIATVFLSDVVRDRTLIAAVVAMLFLGLASLSLSRTVALAERGIITDRWRAVRGGLGATLGIVLGGVGALVALSPAAASALRGAITALVVVLIVMMSPLIWLLTPLVRWLAARYHPAPVTLTPILPLPIAQADGGGSRVADWVLRVPAGILALVPLVVLVIAILLVQRRRPASIPEAAEAHESLFSWAAVKQDLNRLFQRKRPDDLHGWLQQLIGSDPVVRVRRRYVQALMRGQAGGRGRRPAETPAEYRSSLQQAVPGHDHAVDSLTSLYQRARYAPGTITGADADAADGAWQELGTSRETLS